jgi:colanic acid/amylovoran biosynthesis protein
MQFGVGESTFESASLTRPISIGRPGTEALAAKAQNAEPIQNMRSPDADSDPRLNLLLTDSVTCHGGDAAIVLSMVESLRRAFGDPHIRVLAHHVREVRRLYPGLESYSVLQDACGLDVRSKWPRRALKLCRNARVVVNAICARCFGAAPTFLLTKSEREVFSLYREADAVVSVGGGFLTDSYGIALWPRFFGYLTAVILGKPLFFYAQSMGPMQGLIFRSMYRWLFKRAALIIVRDGRSAEFLRGLGIREDKFVVTADEAIAGLGQFDARVPPCDCAMRPQDKRLNIGISVRRWKFPHRSDREELMAGYIEAVRQLCFHLVEGHGAQVTFISTCQGVPGYFADDSELALEIVNALPADVRKSVSVSRHFHHPLDLLAVMRRFDLFVGTRMHTAIMALLAGVPTVAVAYEHKSVDLFSRLGLGEFVLEMDAGKDVLESTVDSAFANADRVREEISGRLGPLRELSAQNAHLVKEALQPALEVAPASVRASM